MFDNLDKLIYFCDEKRHLICTPYSIENLHKMSEELAIKKCWFHSKDGLSHYDIPKRRIKEIQVKCHVVTSKELIAIMKNGIR